MRRKSAGNRRLAKKRFQWLNVLKMSQKRLCLQSKWEFLDRLTLVASIKDTLEKQ